MIINQASGASRKDSIGLSVYYPSSGYINWKYELLNFAKDNNINVPEEYLGLLGEQGPTSVDFSKLPQDLQTAIEVNPSKIIN